MPPMRSRVGVILAMVFAVSACQVEELSPDTSSVDALQRPVGGVAPVLSPEFGINEPILVPATGRQLSPAIATDGTNFLVVWQDVFGIRAARVRPDGTLLDPDGILISEETYYT